jgi:hypothetical protein
LLFDRHRLKLDDGDGVDSWHFGEGP